MKYSIVAFRVLAVVVAGSTFAKAQESNPKQAEPPFGLQWRTSKEDVEAQGVKLTKLDFPDFGDSYQASALPKALSDQVTTYLSFGFDNKLMRIAAIGRSNEHDDYGTEVRARYQELKTVLTKKYGKGKEVSFTHEHYGGDDFAMGLRLNKNWLAIAFDSPDLLIELSVNGDIRGTYWRIVFQHKAGTAALKAHTKQKEEDTL